MWILKSEKTGREKKNRSKREKKGGEQKMNINETEINERQDRQKERKICRFFIAVNLIEIEWRRLFVKHLIYKKNINFNQMEKKVKTNLKYICRTQKIE